MILFVLGMVMFIILLVYVVSTWSVQINEDNEYDMRKQKEQKKDAVKAYTKKKSMRNEIVGGVTVKIYYPTIFIYK